MRKAIRLAAAAAMLLTAAPVAGIAAGIYTIPATPTFGGGASSSLEGPGTIGLNSDGVYGSPGMGINPTFGGLSPTLGATGAANGGVGGTSGGFTGTTGGIAGAPGGLAGAPGGLLPLVGHRG